MKNSILIVILYFLSSFSFPGKEKRCNSCSYEGSISRVKFNEKYGRYVSIGFAQCELVPGIEDEHCKTIDNCFYLEGRIHKSSNSSVGNLKILKAVKYYHGGYTVTDTLAKVGDDGKFAFKVYNRKYDEYIFVEFRDGIYLNYEMRGFNNRSDTTAKSIMGPETPTEWLKLKGTYKKLEVRYMR
ncbi:hypothetical protein [Chitinophaga sp. CF418]|uniref:hypothetical protein n=1 Tax=Chitinophaga sp. CF418 TaxID=1855287 RepID=UPI000922AB57|nr:hypothetical protein [Chitinophaga sp. CF418]SHM14809.1 hypothetical protein SAMN05216311_101719 [Chitinophaga sp. CF418]